MKVAAFIDVLSHYRHAIFYGQSLMMMRCVQRLSQGRLRHCQPYGSCIRVWGLITMCLDFPLAAVSKRAGKGYDGFVARAAANRIAREAKLADSMDNMDLTQLQAVTPKDALRLEKYLRAYHMLTGSVVAR